MKADEHLCLHGLAIKKHATADAIAHLVGLETQKVERILATSVAKGRVIEVKGKYVLSPTARIALEADYSRVYADLRGNARFIAAYEQFETINLALKTLITDWQVVEVAGTRVPNNHSDRHNDEQLIDRLGDLHERVNSVLADLASYLPRLSIYRDKLLAALERAEAGEIEWVSDAHIESYHTVWFELHEDLLRIVGRTRNE